MPDYSDIAAAISLIDDGIGGPQSVDCATLEFEAGSWRVGLSIGNLVSRKHINKSLARAISEAWLEANAISTTARKSRDCANEIGG